MPKYKITPTLLNGFYFFKKSEKVERTAEFKALLNKERFKPNELMLQGIAFEKNVYAICCGQKVEHMPTALEVANEVKGGSWQVTVAKDILVNGQPFLLTGKTDIIKGDIIIDVKRCRNDAFEPKADPRYEYKFGKYFESVQHKIYMVCSGIHNFRYLISDGKTVVPEDYVYTSETFGEVLQAVSDFWEWLHMPGAEYYLNAYLKNWEVK
jgi:hypothetical protein